MLKSKSPGYKRKTPKQKRELFKRIINCEEGLTMEEELAKMQRNKGVWRNGPGSRDEQGKVKPPYVPTPEDIAKGTAEIRSHWSKLETQRRLGEPDEGHIEITIVSSHPPGKANSSPFRDNYA